MLALQLPLRRVNEAIKALGVHKVLDALPALDERKRDQCDKGAPHDTLTSNVSRAMPLLAA